MRSKGIFVVGTLTLALCVPLTAYSESAEGEVARATFASAVVEREPENELSTLAPGAPEVAYFTELKGMDGRTVIHRWEYEGELMGEVAFDVQGPRWRVHSTKQLDPSWTGAWTVKVVDTEGNVLTEDVLQYGSALATAEEPPAATPAAPAE